MRAGIVALLFVTGTASAQVADSIRAYVDTFVVPAVRELDCPAQSLELPTFECAGSLEDGSRFSVLVRKQDPALQVTMITYQVDPPSPLAKAVRDYVQSFAPGVTKVECPAEPATAGIHCQATVETGAVLVHVTRTPDGSFRAGESSLNLPGERILRGFALVLLILGLLLALGGAVQLVRLTRRNFVARVPLVPEQMIVFDRSGQHVMMAEGPRFTMVWNGLQFTLHEAATGQEVPLYRDLLMTRVSGLSRVRHAYRRFTLPNAGAHVLRLVPPIPPRDLSPVSAYFARSFLVSGFFATLAIIAGALMSLAGGFLLL